MTKTSLAVTVVGVIQTFIANKKTFSAHDVTKEVRDIIWHLGGVDTNETGTIFIKGKEVALINHDDVRGIVNRFFKEGYMTDYERTVSDGHWTYHPLLPASGDSVSGNDYDGTSLL